MGTNISRNKQYFWIQRNNQEKEFVAKDVQEKVRLKCSIHNPIHSKRYSISLYTLNNNSTSTLIGSTATLTATSSQTLQFHELFIIQYFFEKEQNIEFEIKCGKTSHRIKSTLAKIMGSRYNSIKEPFGNDKEELKVFGESLKDINADIEFKVRANCRKELFFTIKSLGTINQQIVYMLYKSEIINPTFENGYDIVTIPYMFIGNNKDFSTHVISFEVFHETTKIGEKTGTLDTFLNQNNMIRLKTSQKYVFELQCKYLMRFKFIDYIQGGMQIGLIFAIDFTSSNGDVNDPKSLHYISQGSFNDYESAIYECGKIVSPYDYDQLFPVYGYGAKFDENSPVNHCFQLTFDKDPNVNEIEGVMEVYRKALPRVILHGPTHFAPILKKVNEEVKEVVRQGRHDQYYIVMFLTDGQINDMLDTIDELVEASFLPISVIIIGIGNNDFSSMVDLDADKEPLYDRNRRKAARDLVQFVPFDKFREDSKKLAEEVLEEVPRQVIEYYQMKNIPPGEPKIEFSSRNMH